MPILRPDVNYCQTLKSQGDRNTGVVLHFVNSITYTTPDMLFVIWQCPRILDRSLYIAALGVGGPELVIISCHLGCSQKNKLEINEMKSYKNKLEIL